MTDFHLTDAQRRVLKKARTNGFVMIYGAFGGEGERGFDIDFVDFDRRMHIEVLVGRKLLMLGRGFNQYVLTDAGAKVIESARALKVAA